MNIQYIFLHDLHFLFVCVTGICQDLDLFDALDDDDKPRKYY